MKSMKNGFLYVFINFILDKFQYLTLVEWFKRLGYFLLCNNPKDTQEQALFRSNIVDTYNVFKWMIILILLATNATNKFLTILVWYLLITNIYSYFYHHIWSDNAIDLPKLSVDRARRRFLLLILAVGYSDFCFAYLYKLPYRSEYLWSGDITFLKSTWFSVSNAFAANYDVVKPISDLGNSVSMVQLIITFIFVTIIISKSIPEKK